MTVQQIARFSRTRGVPAITDGWLKFVGDMSAQMFFFYFFIFHISNYSLNFKITEIILFIIDNELSIRTNENMVHDIESSCGCLCMCRTFKKKRYKIIL